MILRRLVENLKHQHWTGVFIELVIVVLGVFIGMQVSNWNQTQADARLGRDYVKRLSLDLEQDQAAIRAEFAYYTAVLKSVQETDALLRAADPDTRALVINAYRATEVTYLPPVRATWDQIVSSGHLGLLPAGAAESGLSQYYAFDVGRDVYNMGLASAYRQTVRRIVPMPMQAAIRAGCSDVRDKSGLITGFVERCEFGADPTALKEVADALRSNPAVAADLRYQYTFAVSATSNLGGRKTAIEDSLTALGARPAVKSEPKP